MWCIFDLNLYVFCFYFTENNFHRVFNIFLQFPFLLFVLFSCQFEIIYFQKLLPISLLLLLCFLRWTTSRRVYSPFLILFSWRFLCFSFSSSCLVFPFPLQLVFLPLSSRLPFQTFPLFLSFPYTFHFDISLIIHYFFSTSFSLTPSFFISSPYLLLFRLPSRFPLFCLFFCMLFSLYLTSSSSSSFLFVFSVIPFSLFVFFSVLLIFLHAFSL